MILMKKLYSLTLLLFLVGSSYGQFGTRTVTYKDVVFEAIVIDMNGSSNFWKVSWEDFVKDRYDAKTKGY